MKSIPMLIMEGLSLFNGVRYYTPVTTYLPVPGHLAYVAWVRVKRDQLVQLADGPEYGRIEAPGGWPQGRRPRRS
jgi:hypothetical protein